MDRKWLETLEKDQLIDMLIKKDQSEHRALENERRATSGLRRVHRIMSNPTASGDEKEATYWIWYEMRRKEAREDGLFHIYNADIVKHSSLSEDKLGKILRKFEERSIISRKLEKKPDKNGQLKTENWMALDQSVLDDPRAIDFGKNMKHGGSRKPRCKNCGSERTIIETKKRVTCCDCGCAEEDKEWTLRRGCDDDLELDEEVF